VFGTVPALRSSVKNAAARPGHDTLKFVMAGLDPAIHLLGKILLKFDGCAGQARA
jgi:hypothetical protein